MKCLVEKQIDVLKTFRRNLTRLRAVMYGKAVHECGTSLDNSFGFIECTRIQIARPGGLGKLQQTTCPGHTLIHCLIFQTITTLYRLVFSCACRRLGGIMKWSRTERVALIMCWGMSRSSTASRTSSLWMRRTCFERAFKVLSIDWTLRLRSVCKTRPWAWSERRWSGSTRTSSNFGPPGTFRMVLRCERDLLCYCTKFLRFSGTFVSASVFIIAHYCNFEFGN